MSLKILLLQARNHGDTAKIDERQSFAQKAGLGLEHIVPHDILSGPPSIKKVLSYDAIMIGGSGDYYVSKQNLPQFQQQLTLLREAVEREHPIFASCFGFQMMVKALGGEVIHDPDSMEVGTFELSLTEAGHNDELLGSMSTKFKAQLGRKDRASQLPDKCLHLASSQRCPFQAIRVAGKPIWATQFHPELSGEENKARFRRYYKGYSSVMNETELEQALSRFDESPETVNLIPRFLDVVFGYKPQKSELP